MTSGSDGRLRVLVADGRAQRIEQVVDVVIRLGHDVIARETSLSKVAQLTAEERPDLALVILGDSSDRALGLIDQIVRESTCPVIAVLDVEDRTFINKAAQLGIFAYIADGDAAELGSSIDIVLRRFAEYHNLEGAFGRRAITERAKGILMERHGIDEGEAFSMLRGQSRRTNRKLVDVAEAIVASHRLLPASGPAERGENPA